MLQGEEAPWVPAGLAASVVMLVAACAGILVARRSRSQIRSSEAAAYRHDSSSHRADSSMKSTSRHGALLRALQKQSAAANDTDSPERHHELYELCGEYLKNADAALQSPSLQAEGRVALRAGQTRVRELQKHHLLTWARNSARTLTFEAQQRVRLFEKVETANRALNCIDTALKVYPDEPELNVSAQAVREFISSSRVAHWVELAERAAFKGHYQRAIDCYRDALYYLTRERADAAGDAAAERISMEIELLQSKLDASKARVIEQPPPNKKKKRTKP
jgi:tetratricopeptide (TPR) repeat protein